MWRSIASISIFISLGGLSAQADQNNCEFIEMQSHDRVVELIQAEGYKAKAVTLDDGARYIETSASGISFELHFTGCDNNFKDCELLLMTAGFDLSNGVSLDVVNSWNQQKYTKAFADHENDPYLNFGVNLVGGVCESNFIDSLNWYGRELVAFTDHIGWPEQDDRDDTPLEPQPT